MDRTRSRRALITGFGLLLVALVLGRFGAPIWAYLTRTTEPVQLVLSADSPLTPPEAVGLAVLGTHGSNRIDGDIELPVFLWYATTGTRYWERIRIDGGGALSTDSRPDGTIFWQERDAPETPSSVVRSAPPWFPERTGPAPRDAPWLEDNRTPDPWYAESSDGGR